MRLSSPLCKKNWLRRTPKSAIYPLTSRPSEGAYRDRHGRRGGMRWTPSIGRGDSHNSDAIRVAGRRRRVRSSLRGANGSRECAPDDRFRDEAIHPCFLDGLWIAGARNDALNVAFEIGSKQFDRERAALSVSSPAKAGDPVLRGVDDGLERSRRTGYPACWLV
jgi:hypothetical protein